MSEETYGDNKFNKKFAFTNNDRWSLPSDAYKTSAWKIESLQNMKKALNTVKSQLSNYPLTEWSNHTKYTEPSGMLIPTIANKNKIELLTQAWCKFYECLYIYPIVPKVATQKQKLNSLHLCEAPGAFISALNYFLYTNHRKIKWKWNGSSLNPYYEGNSLSEMIYDDRLIRHTIQNWDFGPDRTGDIKKFYNHRASTPKYSNVMLVTADGSVDCMEKPGEQEQNTHFLHYCEAMTALKILREHGSLVLKLFTMFEHGTVCLMYLLNCCFKRVHVFKPCSSKSGNSEVYVICLQYKGFSVLEKLWEALLHPYVNGELDNVAMFDLAHIDGDFLQQLESCADFFMNLQCNRINRNIELFQVTDEGVRKKIHEAKHKVADVFLCNYSIAAKMPKQRLLIVHNENRQFVNVQQWDFKVINVFPPLDDENFIQIKVGRGIELVQASEFGHVPMKEITDDQYLLAAISGYLSQNYLTVRSCCFQADAAHYLMQREFFKLVKGYLKSGSDIVVYGIPLLTRFLVGVVYILSLAFESVLIYKGGAIIFRNPNTFRVNCVQKYFESISNAFSNLKSEEYVCDVLEVVPMTFLENGNFYEVICKYNNGHLL